MTACARRYRLIIFYRNIPLPANGCVAMKHASPFYALYRSLLGLGISVMAGCAHEPPRQAWTFAVSGDSRDCGNTVMPAIARGAREAGASFYWHLGDLRKIRAPDFDFLHEGRFAGRPPSTEEYVKMAWPDFLEHQVAPFGEMPFFLGIGNHETVPPKTRVEFRSQFSALLDRAELRAQRQLDGKRHLTAAPRSSTYYHWVERGVDFFNLDNASDDNFDEQQLRWFDEMLDTDVRDPAVTSIVVAMHEALPYSLSGSHSMCGSDAGMASGEHVYRKLIEAQDRHKRVYILASHSHYYLANVFNTGYWRDPAHHARVLPGWIVGSAGAERYVLPAGMVQGPDAQAHIYGYLIGSVARDGRIQFSFHALTEVELQLASPPDYAPDDVHACFEGNPDLTVTPPAAPIEACPVEATTRR
jgi:hypothetical protein